MPTNAPLWLAIVVLFVAQALTAWQVWVANKAREGVDVSARSTRFGEDLHWAAQMAISKNEAERRLGNNVLAELAKRPNAPPEDRGLAIAALAAAVAPPAVEWDTARRTGEPATVVRVEPQESEDE